MELPPPSTAPGAPGLQPDAATAAESTAALRWLIEEAMAWAHWGLVGLVLLLPPLVPMASWATAVLLALGLAAGNAAIHWLLRRGFQPARQLRVSAMATALEYRPFARLSRYWEST